MATLPLSHTELMIVHIEINKQKKITPSDPVHLESYPVNSWDSVLHQNGCKNGDTIHSGGENGTLVCVTHG